MVEVYSKGQIVIPKYIRDMLKIFPGTRLRATVEGGRIVLEPERDWEKEFDELTSRKGKALSDEEVEERIKASEKRMLKEWSHVP